MATFTNPPLNLDKRGERRSCAELFLDIRAMDERVDNEFVAHSTDISDSGIGLITHKTYPVGTPILISKYGQFIAVGEVVNLNEDWESWDCYSIDRMGIRLIGKKTDWKSL